MKTKISLAAILCLLLFGCSLFRNSTEKLISKYPIEMISVEEIVPFAPTLYYGYEITPDLKARWYEYDPYGRSDKTEILRICEKPLTQQQYDDIVNAIAANDFLSFPEELEPWQGADGPSQEIAVTADGTTYRSGGYFPTETNSKFANIWSALAGAGVFEEEGYTILYPPEAAFWQKEFGIFT